MKDIITSEIMTQFPGVVAALSKRVFGNLSFQHPVISEKQTLLNRKRFFNYLNIDEKRLVNIGLNHGNLVYWTKYDDIGRGSVDKRTMLYGYDGIATNIKNVFLMVTVADCFPIFFYDLIHKSLAISHAGWRGVESGIIAKTIETMCINAKSNPSDIIVYVGPGIHRCHFVVSDDVSKIFKDRFGSDCLVQNKNNISVDLPLIIERQLISANVLKSNIEISKYCTACRSDILSSYRRDKNSYIAQGAVIGMI